MKLLTASALLFSATFWLTTTSSAGEALKLEYHYSGDTGVNLSTIAGGPLSLSSLIDKRPDVGSNDILLAGKEAYTLTEQTSADLVTLALSEALESSGAKLAQESALRLEGNLLDMQIQETDQGLEVLIRCELNLRNQGRSSWQSVVQSRTAIVDNNVAQGIAQGLDRLIRSLFMDDYFLMELGIF